MRSLPKLLAETFEGDSAVVLIGRQGKPGEGATHGVPDEALARYAAHYHTVDPWSRAGYERLPTLTAARGSDMVPEARFKETEFYVDFAKGIGTVRALGGHVPYGPLANCQMVVHRPWGVTGFSEADVARLDAFLPHLAGAMHLRRQFAECRADGFGFEALQRLAFGVVVCEASGRIRFANAAAEALAGRPGAFVLGRSADGFTMARTAERRRLLALIADAALGGPGGELTVPAEDGSLLLLRVAPLRATSAGGRALALLTLQASSAAPSVDPAALSALFGLTRAEAELALALFAGQALGDVGRRRGVTEPTLRTQLARIFQKTGARDQRDLMRLFGLIPPLRR